MNFARHSCGRSEQDLDPVQLYVNAQKNMRFVRLKSEMQIDMQSLHHLRDRLVDGRTTLIDQRRAILLQRR